MHHHLFLNSNSSGLGDALALKWRTSNEFLWEWNVGLDIYISDWTVLGVVLRRGGTTTFVTIPTLLHTTRTPIKIIVHNIASMIVSLININWHWQPDILQCGSDKKMHLYEQSLEALGNPHVSGTVCCVFYQAIMMSIDSELCSVFFNIIHVKSLAEIKSSRNRSSLHKGYLHDLIDQA